MRISVFTATILFLGFGNAAIAACTVDDGKKEKAASDCPQNTAEIYILKAAGDARRKDFKSANYLFCKAAALGNAQAEFALGNTYYSGLGVPKDYGEAMRWYRKAADQESGVWSLMAQNAIGWMYLHGEGVPKNPDEAVRWYRKTIDKGAMAEPQDGASRYEVQDARYVIDVIYDRNHARQPLPAGNHANTPLAQEEPLADRDCKGIMAHRCYMH